MKFALSLSMHPVPSAGKTQISHLVTSQNAAWMGGGFLLSYNKATIPAVKVYVSFSIRSAAAHCIIEIHWQISRKSSE